MLSKLKFVHRLIAFGFRLGQLAEKKSILQFLSIVSAGLKDDEPESTKTRFILQQVGKKVLPDLMSEYQGIFGDGFNSVQEQIENIYDYTEKSLQVEGELVREMGSHQPIFRQYLEHIKPTALLILGEE